MSDSNPYGSQTPVNSPDARGIIESSRAMQEVQAAIVMAKHDRRNPIIAADEALKECDRVTLAQAALYAYPRGGNTIEGPSIRLAEALARAWGNMQYGTMEIGRDGDESTMLAYAWDLQANTMARMEFRVKHVRDTKHGPKELRDERDVYELNANQGSRRLRACILRMIPGDIVDACVERCRLTLEKAMGRIEDAIPRMIEKFDAIGVTQAMIERRLKKTINAMTYQELVSLGNIFNALRDGMGVVEDYFEPAAAPQTKPPEGGRADAARAAAARAAQNTAPPKAPPPVVPPKEPEAPKQAEQPQPAPKAPEKAPEQPKAPEAGKVVLGAPPANLFSDEITSLNTYRGEVYKVIVDLVPIAERGYYTSMADIARDRPSLEAVMKTIKDKYQPKQQGSENEEVQLF